MKSPLKFRETQRLFYKKYLYKLVLRNELNTFFRTELQKKGTLSHTRFQLDKLTEDYRNGEPLTKAAFRSRVSITENDYLDAKDIYYCLKNYKNYKVRVDPNCTLTIFSNDENFLLSISQKMRVSNREFWKPSETNKNILLNNPKIKIVDHPVKFPLQVYFNSNEVPKDFANWLEANTDKCKIGRIALESVKDYGSLYGFYMYVRDEKILNLVTLLVGSSVRSVEKLVYKGDLDKYMYAE